MAGSFIGVVALVGVLLWLMGVGRRRPAPQPEDDILTPMDRDELAEAEAELAQDPSAKPIHEALGGDAEDDDDWGPGSSRSGLPGIL